VYIMYMMVCVKNFFFVEGDVFELVGCEIGE